MLSRVRGGQKTWKTIYAIEVDTDGDELKSRPDTGYTYTVLIEIGKNGIEVYCSDVR